MTKDKVSKGAFHPMQRFEDRFVILDASKPFDEVVQDAYRAIEDRLARCK